MEDIIAVYTAEAPPIAADFSTAVWQSAVVHKLPADWRGGPAPAELDTETRILWTNSDLYIGFNCAYTELDADADDDVDVSVERYALWERDVCEAFIRSPAEPAATSYLEFEVAPTAQWCDLRIDRVRSRNDWQWQSGMKTAAAIDRPAGRWRALMAIPFACFGTRPEAGEDWMGNLFRISRVEGRRCYLAWSPTYTDLPNFHVPERFVRWRFSAR